MDIQHRFGTVKNGYEDFWGFFAPSNIRIGFSYVPINKLNVGIGVTKTTASIIPGQSPSAVSGPLWDGSLKYSIITQTKGDSRLALLIMAMLPTIQKKNRNMMFTKIILTG